MDGHNGQGVPARWGGRIGLWPEGGAGGTEISIRRIRPANPTPWRVAVDWVYRWPLIAVGVALLVGLVVGLRSER
jgi:uncharacterized membrane protein YdfJ with MMPL/SSD domain